MSMSSTDIAVLIFYLVSHLSAALQDSFVAVQLNLFWWATPFFEGSSTVEVPRKFPTAPTPRSFAAEVLPGF